MAPDILPGERLDAVNDKIELIQKPDGLTFGTDALLLAGYIRGKYGEAAELGGGSGIISMLVATREKAERITVYEVQGSYADLAERNIRHNSLSDKVRSVCLDCREIPREMYGKCELLFTNPPYMKADSGYLNVADGKCAARHEMNGDISDFVLSAAQLLKYGGAFYAVYRPDRLCDLITAMRDGGIEPKAATFVHARADSEPSMLLIAGRRGGKPGMKVTRPLVIYGDDGKYTDDMNYIMDNGSFPPGYSL